MLLSLFLHALVLLGLAPQFAPAEFSVPPARILQGVLLPGMPPVSVAAAAPEAILQRNLSPAAVVATPPRPVRKTNVAATQKLQPDPAPTQPAAANAVQSHTAVSADAVPPAPTFAQPSVPNKTPAIASVTPGGVVSRASAGPATVAMAQESSDSGANAAGLRQFRVALASEARRFRRYPETARRDGLTGTAEVRVTIETGLPARRVDLSRSSGYAVLDAAAVEMLRQAVTRVELPESLRGQNFAVLLPVVFEVED
ncbi:MAG: TonB family protein [Rhodocyclaceae bacterium]|nr:TonB family protein [Rhodocyclaceae bacterium]